MTLGVTRFNCERVLHRICFFPFLNSACLWVSFDLKIFLPGSKMATPELYRISLAYSGVSKLLSHCVKRKLSKKYSSCPGLSRLFIICSFLIHSLWQRTAWLSLVRLETQAHSTTQTRSEGEAVFPKDGLSKKKKND